MENNNAPYSEHLHRFCALESNTQGSLKYMGKESLSGTPCQRNCNKSVLTKLLKPLSLQAEPFLDKTLLNSSRLCKESINQPKIPTHMNTVAGTPW